MKTPPLLADFIHARGCKLICAKLLTLPNCAAHKVRRDSRIAAQGMQSLVRNEVTQNSPDIRCPGCSAS